MAVLIKGESPLATQLDAEFARAPNGLARLLVNADGNLDSVAIMARCEQFAAACPLGEDSLIITILPEPPVDFAAQAAVGALWAFTRAAALAWAGHGIRVNAVGLGAAPAGPFEAQEQTGRAPAANVPAPPATFADVARTIRAIASWTSMTGQIVRLGV